MRYTSENIDTTAVKSILSGIPGNFNVTPAFALLSLIPLILVDI